MKQYQYILTRTTVGGSETLTHNPAGWDELGITYMRHEVYHSVLRSFTLSLRFANKNGGGYDYIKAQYDAYGIYADMAITINQRNPNTNAYELLYTGVLDFSPDTFSIDQDYIEVKIVDSSKLQKFAARDENEIDLLATKSLDNVTITPLSKSTITLEPVNIITKTNAICAIVEERSWDNFDVMECYIENPTFSINQISGVTILTDGGGTVPQALVYTNDSTITKTIKIKYSSSYRFYGTFVYTGEGSLRLAHYLKHFNSAHTLLSTEVMNYITIYTTSSPQTIDSSGIIDKEYTITVAPSETIEIVINMYVAGALVNPGPYMDITQEETLNIQFVETTPGKAATDSYAMIPYNAFQSALNIIGCGTTLDSSILESGGDMYGDLVMSGFMIRNNPNAKLSVTFRDLFRSFDAVGNLGFGYDKTSDLFTIEKKSFYYDNSIIAELGEVKNFKRKPLSLAFFSKISGGYDNTGDYERVQGASEFAVAREYSAAAKVKETKDIKSKYRYDSVGIEDLRNKQYLNTENTDDNSDNDIFVVRSVYNAGKFTPATLSEVEFPNDAKGADVFGSYYNLMLTPRQNAIRWGNVISACHTHIYLPFKEQKTTKLFELEIGSDYVDENSDIELSELESPLFLPELYSFDYYITSAMLTAIEANPNGVFTFYSNGIQYAGYIDKLETKKYNKTANFQLIACEVPPFNFIFEDNIDANYIFEDNINANKTFE